MVIIKLTPFAVRAIYVAWFTIFMLLDVVCAAQKEISTKPKIISLPIDYWQTYSQNSYTGTSEHSLGVTRYRVERLKPFSNSFRTGYAFVLDGKLVFEDRGNGHCYLLHKEGGHKKIECEMKPNFYTKQHLFSYNEKSGRVAACLINNAEKCREIKIKDGTFPYVYAFKNNAVIVISNYGDALLYKNDRWCRMHMSNDVYTCKLDQPGVLDVPRKVQFYTSINYRGRVLLGEWPTGRLYEFDGSRLAPSDMTPPYIEALSDKRLGYEAQTMAEYCGDLFVGYWPKGEIWRFDYRKNNWVYFKRLFSEEVGEAFIPYSDRDPDELDSAFFGQRVTAMVPYENSLYAITSNLRSWKVSTKIPRDIPSKKISEYGAIYKITGSNCFAKYKHNGQKF